LQSHTPEECWRNERALADALRSGLAEIPGVRVLAAGENSLPVVAFYSERIHPVDLAQMLQMRGIALRCGKHCAHVAHERMGLDATLRASIGIYNTQEDVDALLMSMREIMRRWEKRYGR
ncbi:MAG: aminotransferase class V-fold PLP-dependent enzyme, partial [Clostridiales bacterium]|nr:aminotransferase class V-fold PLP-dependent enzyme [Clostridiales bacterium]